MADIITYWGNDNRTEPCLPGLEYESYNDSLTITSEADLLTPNAYGQPVYDPFTEEDYGNIETRIKRLGLDFVGFVVKNSIRSSSFGSSETLELFTFYKKKTMVKKETIKWVIQILASVLTALATALGTSACVALA